MKVTNIDEFLKFLEDTITIQIAEYRGNGRNELAISTMYAPIQTIIDIYKMFQLQQLEKNE